MEHLFRFSDLPNFEKVRAQKELEKFVLKNDGMVYLYAESQLSRQGTVKMKQAFFRIEENNLNHFQNSTK